jgi:sterol desaturase/sphingolipid hydroxylase (fatty acid hydroxylase superfamily)
MNLIALAVPFFLLAIAIEWLWGRWSGRDTYRLTDTVSSLTLGGLSQARRFVALGVGGSVYAWLSSVTPFATWTAEGWAAWVAAFCLYDLCYYCSHRAGHEIKLFWASHVVHHQSEDYNLSTALRQTSSGFLFGWIFYTPLFFIGVPVEMMVTVGALNLIYQFWVHTEHVGELGWFEYVFVSPSNHRVHHARNTCYLDRNYGGVFIIWDRLFGTYQRELPSEPCVYGITKPIKSWSPIEAWIHVYRDILSDMVRTRRWGERLWVPFSHPAWQPSDLRSDATKKGEEDGPFEKYDPKISRVRKMSGAVNLILITLLLLLAQQSEMLVGFEMYVWALMLWLGVANAALLSNVDSRLFRLQEIVKALTLGVFALQLPTFTAILVISLALLGSGWQWIASKEVAVATS